MFLNKLFLEFNCYLNFFLRTVKNYFGFFKNSFKKYKKIICFFIYLIVTYIVCPFFTRWVDYLCWQIMVDVLSVVFSIYVLLKTNIVLEMCALILQYIQTTINYVYLFAFYNFIFTTFFEIIELHVLSSLNYLFYLISVVVSFFFQVINYFLPIFLIRNFIIVNASTVLFFVCLFFFLLFFIEISKNFFFLKKKIIKSQKAKNKDILTSIQTSFFLVYEAVKMVFIFYNFLPLKKLKNMVKKKNRRLRRLKNKLYGRKFI